MTKIAKEDIIGYECKHVVYTKARNGEPTDMLLIKEYICTKDGRRIPNIRKIKDFRREFWVTKEMFQNHTDKKEWEDVKKLTRYETTQVELESRIARAIGRPGFKGNYRKLVRNQYVYGADITTTAIMKNRYLTQYPDLISPNSVAVLDIETDVVHGHKKILSVALTFKDRVLLTVTKDFLGTIQKPEEKIRAAMTKYLGKYEEERKIKLEIAICDSPAQAVKTVMEHAHEWTPDFIAIWNIAYDLPIMIAALEEEGIDPADVFSDPSVPPLYRRAYFNKGLSYKTKDNGDQVPLAPADQWHTMECPAGFYFIDAMCVYRKIRVAKQKEPGYDLDSTLERNLGVRKLKFEEGAHLKKLQWHIFMQSNYKIEYLIYNIFDCIGVELLDELTKDLALTISVNCEHSDYDKFPSQPRRTVDDLHFFVQQYGKVIATTSDQMSDENEELVVEKENWIVTLPAHNVVPNGLAIIKELPFVKSGMRANVADLDVGGAYPNGQDILNMSKETTYRELCKMKDITMAEQRRAGINLTAGTVNAVEIVVDLFKAPNLDDMLASFMADEGMSAEDIMVVH